MPIAPPLYGPRLCRRRVALNAPAIHLLGLGYAAAGRKTHRLLHLLQSAGKRLSYTPSDVSTAMVLVAREAALDVVADRECHPLVCDLATADDLPSVLDELFSLAPSEGERVGVRGIPNEKNNNPRLITFFGMIPNFEQQQILPRLAALVRRGDQLLFSANLAPSDDYLAGIRLILPLYDNQPTREWLLTFLLDLGVEPRDGELRFTIQDTDPMPAATSETRRCPFPFHAPAAKLHRGSAAKPLCLRGPKAKPSASSFPTVTPRPKSAPSSPRTAWKSATNGSLNPPRKVFSSAHEAEVPDEIFGKNVHSQKNLFGAPF